MVVSESNANQQRSTFRPDIEGMRAVAVVLVLVFHAFGAPFTGDLSALTCFSSSRVRHHRCVAA